MERPRCLHLSVEPTPYQLALIAALRMDDGVLYEPWFITVNASQNWGADGGADSERILAPPGISTLGRVRRLLRLAFDICRRRYAVAHLPGWGHPVLLWAMVWLKLARVPFSMESDTQRSSDGRSVKEWIKARLYPRLFRWPRVMLPGGSRQAEFFRFYGVPEERIRVAFMTADVAAIRAMPLAVGVDEWRRRWNIDGDATVFLFAGRLEPYKGIDALLEAFRAVAERHPRCWLVIVGAGSLAPAGEPSATRRVVWTGRQPFRDVVQWMRSSDVLVLPSTFEPWGLVVNEAMACGLPVIATDRVGAVDDLVTDGKTGFVVPASEPAALAAAMEQCAVDPARTRAMGEAAADIIADWTTEREATIIQSVVKDMVSGR